MSYQMGTAQLQTWESLNQTFDHKQTISLKIDGIDSEQLAAALNEAMSHHSVLSASLVKSPEFVNPVVAEAEAGAATDAPKCYVGTRENAADTADYNLAFFLKVTDEALQVDCVFNPVLVDAHSVMSILSQALKVLSGDATLVESQIDFSKYAPWSNDIVNEEEPAAKLLWDELYKKGKQWSEMPFGFEIRQAEAVKSFQQVSACLTLPAPDSPVLNDKLASSPYPLALSLLYAYYALYTDSSSPVIGVALNGRAFEELQSIIGPLTRQVPFALNGEMATSFIQLLEQVEARWLEMEEWQEYAPAEAKAQAELKQNTSFHFTDQQQYFEGIASRVEIEQALCKNGAALNWHFVRKSDRVYQILLEFDKRSIPPSLAEMMVNQLSHLANQLLMQPNKALGKIDLLSDRDESNYLQSFRGKKVPIPNETICSLFDKAAIQNPDGVAIWYKEKPLTYHELKAEAEVLAGHIRKRLAILSSAVVGVEIPSSPEQIIALLGIMKAGFTYLPLDPDLPKGRKQQLLQKANAVAIVQDSLQVSTTYELDALLIFDVQSLNGTEQGQLPSQDSEQQAYLIFTSGSTGEPKGVPIRHRNIVNTLLWRIDAYGLNNDTVTLQLPDFSFDSAVEDIFCTLLAGGTLVLTDKDLKKEVINLSKLIAAREVTNFLIVPSLYKTLLPHLKEGASSIKSITVAGEALPDSLAQEHFLNFPQVALVNEYGPTECAVCTSFIRLSANENINIGRPIHNMSVFVVDEQNALLPVGQKGQLMVSGPGIFDGYLGDDTPNPAHFVELTVDGESFSCYNTGDYCRFSHDGKLYFEGRKDDQIKLRGYRINLGEIEKRILENEGVSECLVLVDKDENQEGILAYFITEDSEAMLEEALEKSLKNVLPAYMLPNHFVKIAQWPLNKNGKLDKQQLKQLFKHTTQLLLPQTEQEEVLLKVWKSVLNKTEISIDDDFYKVGGDSIKSIQMAASLFEIGYQLKVKEIFQNPVLKDQARIMIRQEVSVSSQEPVYGAVPLSPIQKYFFSLPDWLDLHYCQSVLLKLEVQVQIEEIQACIDALVEHHDMLRASYGTSPVSQEITRQSIKVQQVDYTGNDAVAFIEEQAQDYFQKANLKTQALFQVIQINSTENTHLMILAHHLLVDTMSWRILLEDLNKLLQKVTDKKELALPLKTNSYKAFAEELLTQPDTKNAAITHYLNEVRHFKNEAFLKQVKKPNSQSSEEVKVRLTLEEAKVTAINQQLSNARLQWRDLLLATLGKAMKSLFEQDKMLVFIESHGRESNLNLNRTIGWFTNVFPAVLPTSSDSGLVGLVKDLGASLSKLQELSVNYYAHQDLKIYDAHATSRPHDVIFNFLGDLDSDLERLNAFEVVKQGFEGEMARDRNRESVLEIFAWVQNRKLEVEFIYSETQLDKGLIERLYEICEAEMNSFLNVEEIQDSKFDYNDLSEEDLQTLFD